jgi:hydroxyacylglutathione hydrolase
MNIQAQPMGPYQTNCYILTVDGKDFIIDPGVDALAWIKDHVTNPVAILNTHGHFDHVWSNQEVQDAFNIPIYCPKGDIILLENDHFGLGTPPSTADIIIEGTKDIIIQDVNFRFWHYPGHTPGCSMIQFDDHIFSGDFIFEGSIGRYDFPLSDAQQMKESLEHFMSLDFDATLYPGHGNTTTIKNEQRNVPSWIRNF